MTTRIEKYTVGLDLPPQDVLCCVFGLEGISGMDVFLFTPHHRKMLLTCVFYWDLREY